MTAEQYDIFFGKQDEYFTSLHSKKNSLNPFKDHPQLTLITDILGRKENHHIIINSDHSPNILRHFLEAIQTHLMHEDISHHLKNSEVIYINTDLLSFIPNNKNIIDNNIKSLREKLEYTESHLIIVMPEINMLTNVDNNHHLHNELKLFFTHTKCRFIFLNTASQKIHLTKFNLAQLTLAELSDHDISILLKHERTELENYHHVLMTDEILDYALKLSERYLGDKNIIDNALLLLDSSASRVSPQNKNEINNQTKPSVTIPILTSVLSGWTTIPATHLQLTKTKLIELIHHIQQRIFGQDAAISMLSHHLQQIHSHTQKQFGPFYSLLLAGPEHSGKRSMSLALVDQLFKQLNLLYIAHPSSLMVDCLSKIKLQRCTDKLFFSLEEIVKNTPYAVIMIENVDQASPDILNNLQEILATGFLNDSLGKRYNFRQIILILTTTLGSPRLAELNTITNTYANEANADLLQLVMHDHKNTVINNEITFSPQDLLDLLLPDIIAKLSDSLCHYLNIIPFLPLNKDAIEKIIRLKLQILSKQLNSRYNVELGYAPEVIRYLINDVQSTQAKNRQVVDIDNALKHLYFCVEQTIFSHAENKIRPAQLFLQLNEMGESLRCDWLSMSAIR